VREPLLVLLAHEGVRLVFGLVFGDGRAWMVWLSHKVNASSWRCTAVTGGVASVGNAGRNR